MRNQFYLANTYFTRFKRKCYKKDSQKQTFLAILFEYNTETQVENHGLTDKCERRPILVAFILLIPARSSSRFSPYLIYLNPSLKISLLLMK